MLRTLWRKREAPQQELSCPSCLSRFLRNRWRQPFLRNGESLRGSSVPVGARVFRPPLLEDRGVGFLACALRRGPAERLARRQAREGPDGHGADQGRGIGEMGGHRRDE